MHLLLSRDRQLCTKKTKGASVARIFLAQRRKDAKKPPKRGSALRLCAFAREISSAKNTFCAKPGLPIKTIHVPQQRERAWEIAREFQLPTVYDATYLALAELRQCEFWTADEKLFKRVRDKLSFVQWLGNYSLNRC